MQPEDEWERRIAALLGDNEGGSSARDRRPPSDDPGTRAVGLLVLVLLLAGLVLMVAGLTALLGLLAGS
jgi:hypothetical protein